MIFFGGDAGQVAMATSAPCHYQQQQQQRAAVD